ncbi:MAG: ABC transporter ATP-binding protein [Thermoanaerobaculia bacterium]
MAARGALPPRLRPDQRLSATSGPVEVNELSACYGERKALDQVSFRVAAGEIFGLLGPNGGGKTTLFRILATLQRPSSGSFRIAGLDPEGDRRALRRRLGVVFQSPSLDRKLTVRENLAFQGALYGLSGARLAERARALLLRLSIADRADDLVETLSGGLARRVEIAKALLHAPSVLLLDEPSTGLDPGARKDLRELLAELARRDGTTVLLTTHLFEEAEASDRIGILDRGRLLALGTPAELKQTVGGDVITLETADGAEAIRLGAEIGRRFGATAGAPAAVGSAVRIELQKAHAFIPPLVEAFPGRFRSVTLGAPSLEDVFVARTGRLFRENEPGEVAS